MAKHLLLLIDFSAGFAGLTGYTGLTGYFGIVDVGKVKAGDFVVISGAAGAMGSVAGQIAKLKGATVLRLAGSDEKVRWLLEDLVFDQALNYKDKDFVEKFMQATEASSSAVYPTLMQFEAHE